MRPARRGGRQKIVPNSLRLPYFASYFFSFFFSQRRRAAKECKALNNFLLWGNFNLLLQRSNIFFFAQGVVFRSVWLPEALAAWRLCELFFFRAKPQSRKEIVPNSLRLPYFAACPAELRVRRGGFFFAQRRRGAKELWSARYDFRRPLCLPYFAACLAELRGAIFFFFAQRPVRRGGRKEIMVCSV